VPLQASMALASVCPCPLGNICYGLYCFVDARYRDVAVGAGT
jgi:hypothetical protein